MNQMTDQANQRADGSMLAFDELKQVVRKGGVSSSADPYWVSRYLFRPWTIYFTWAAMRLRLSANVVTLISGVAWFGAAICYGLPWPWVWLLGAVLVQVWLTLDHVDGELARYEQVVLKKKTGKAGLFYDTACHPGEAAMKVAMALRLFVEMGQPWWLIVLVVLVIFPGMIAPWQRYCETLIDYAATHKEGCRAWVPAEYVTKQSLVLGTAGGNYSPSRMRKVVGQLLQTIGPPGTYLLLLVCTGLDFAFENSPVSFLLLWLIVRGLHTAAAAMKSTLVYGRHLKGLE